MEKSASLTQQESETKEEEHFIFKPSRRNIVM